MFKDKKIDNVYSELSQRDETTSVSVKVNDDNKVIISYSTQPHQKMESKNNKTPLDQPSENIHIPKLK